MSSLSGLCERLKQAGILISAENIGNLEVSEIANNSGEVKPGTLFCAIRGAKTDGHRFIPDALAKGAAAIVISEECTLPPGLPVLRVSDGYAAWGLLCEFHFGFPARDMDVFAVTGTNGKTSIAYLMRRFLQTAFTTPCGLISTVEYDTGKGVEEGGRTTPEARHFQELFSAMRQNGCRHAMIEGSSHGLHQHRTGSLRFAGAIFTNLTGDHLDYHRTMEAYYQAKKILFAQLLRENAPAVINLDDPYGKRLAGELNGVRVLGVSQKDPAAFAKISNITLSGKGVSFELKMEEHLLSVHSVMIGEHNVYNLAEAAVLAYAIGMKPELIVSVLAQKDIAPPGRLEGFLLRNGARAFVDYAHTDDALARVLTAMRSFAEKRIITVFGCGGDRDRTKRPRMAQAVSKLSDFSVLTSDNPRTEDPLFILSEIESGMLPGSSYLVEPDRRKAIALAVENAGEDDLILIAGKGHENYQEINGVKHPFDDREELRKYL